MTDLYTYTVPIFIKTLGGLKNVLFKAQAHAKENGIDEATLLNDCLASDMFPLVKQVQTASDNAKGAVARLAGIEVPRFEDVEATFAELIARIDKTITFLESVSPESFVEAASRQVMLPYYKDKYMTGLDYAREYALPNFFFHTVTAYGLVRKNGVAIGKADYINGLPLKPLE